MKSATNKKAKTNSTNSDSQAALTATDISGFANTLEAIRNSKAIPEGHRLELCKALDLIADDANVTDPLTPRALNSWLPDFLGVSKPQIACSDTPATSYHRNSLSHHAGGKLSETGSENESARFDLYDYFGPLQRLVNTLTVGDDDACEALIAILRLIDKADDDDKCVIISQAIDYAYAQSADHTNSLQEYLTDLSSQSSDYAQLEAVTPNGRSKHASDE